MWLIAISVWIRYLAAASLDLISIIGRLEEPFLACMTSGLHYLEERGLI